LQPANDGCDTECKKTRDAKVIAQEFWKDPVQHNPKGTHDHQERSDSHEHGSPAPKKECRKKKAHKARRHQEGIGNEGFQPTGELMKCGQDWMVEEKAQTVEARAKPSQAEREDRDNRQHPNPCFREWIGEAQRVGGRKSDLGPTSIIP
jgi:hypothetical protein